MKMKKRVLRFLIKLEERLVDFFEPYLEDDEILESREAFERHRREMEVKMQDD